MTAPNLFTPPRPLTQGERSCRSCGAAAVFFLNFTDVAWAWCRTCSPAEFRPGAAPEIKGAAQ